MTAKGSGLLFVDGNSLELMVVMTAVLCECTEDPGLAAYTGVDCVL